MDKGAPVSFEINKEVETNHTWNGDKVYRYIYKGKPALTEATSGWVLINSTLKPSYVKEVLYTYATMNETQSSGYLCGFWLTSNNIDWSCGQCAIFQTGFQVYIGKGWVYDGQYGGITAIIYFTKK